MGKQTVTVRGLEYRISTSCEERDYWIAQGAFRGENYEARGKNEMKAIKAWMSWAEGKSLQP